MKKTFFGGVHPSTCKTTTCHKSIVELTPPKELIYPMQQHIGAPCNPCVAVGDEVRMGQMIGEANGNMSASVHSSVSGTVKAIEKRMHPNGLMIQSVIIENDGLDTPVKAEENCDYKKLSADEIRQRIKDAGVVGMGGATFPTHVKLSPPPDAKIDYVIINGAECEPYLTSDHRVMLENSDEVIGGLKILMHLFNLKDGYVGIEDNKPDAISTMKEAAAKEKEVNIHIVPLKTKYPQGGEKQLIKAITGRKVGPGQLPFQVGCIVNNVDTCTAVYRAVVKGLPLMHRIVTVAGDCVSNPENLRVRIGTPFSALFEHAGDFKEEPHKFIMGGPMMGLSLPNTDVPVIKGSSGALAFGEENSYALEETACVRCGKCVYVCPMRLLPNLLDANARLNNLDELKKLNISDCIECGSCAYVCPSKRRQVQQIKVAKAKIRKSAQK